MRQAVALFSEKETRDELGLGSIRDAISNALFPGTSVIQTRLKYALFIPWMYRELEKNNRVHSSSVAALAREAEVALVGPLESTGEQGNIGSRAKGTLQRLPSSIYWLALQRWGIFEQSWSVEDYHRSWERLREAMRSGRHADDHGVALETVRTWNAHLPAPPERFPEEVSFALRLEDAEFIQERLRQSCRGTLLGHAADLAGPDSPDLDAPTPWDAFQGKVPAPIWEQLVLARRFSTLMHGAARMYNLALAQRSEALEEKAHAHKVELAAWHEDADAEQVATWSLDELWAFSHGRANVTPRTREFITTWQLLYRELGAAVAGSPEAAKLVEQREWQLKGNRSRFRNPRALEVWGGESGTARMNYRWGTVRTLLGDLYEGISGAEA